MADDASTPGAAWPSPNFRFQVRWGRAVLLFQEVSGLDASSQAIEYRRGNAKSFTPLKMPGLPKHGNVTFKRGILKGDSELFERIKTHTMDPVPVTISLLDEAGTPTMVWTLSKAWPTKMTGAEFKSEGNEVAIESIDVAYEGLVVGDAS